MILVSWVHLVFLGSAVFLGPCIWRTVARPESSPARDLRGYRESPGTSAPHGKVRTVGVPEQRCTGAPAGVLTTVFSRLGAG